MFFHKAIIVNEKVQYAGGLSLKISLGAKVAEGEWLCTTNLICTINYFVFIYLFGNTQYYQFIGIAVII